MNLLPMTAKNPAGSILIFSKFVKYLRQQDAAHLVEILTTAADTEIRLRYRRDRCFQAGLMHYYGIRVSENIRLAKRNLAFASRYSPSEKTAIKSFATSVVAWIKCQLANLSWCTNNYEAANELRYYQHIRPLDFRLGPLLRCFTDIMSCFATPTELAPLNRNLEKLQIAHGRECVSKAALACINILHGNDNEINIAVDDLRMVNPRFIRHNSIEQAIGDLFLGNRRTFLVNGALRYFEYLDLPNTELDGSFDAAEPNDFPDKIHLSFLAPEEPTSSEKKMAARASSKKPVLRISKMISKQLFAPISFTPFSSQHPAYPIQQASEKALFWVKRASANGEVQALFISGLRYQSRGFNVKAFHCYQCAAKIFSLRLTPYLSQMLMFASALSSYGATTLPQCSTTVPPAYLNPHRIFHNNGFAEAYRALSLCYLRGIGVEADVDKAFEMMLLYCVNMKIGRSKGLSQKLSHVIDNLVKTRSRSATSGMMSLQTPIEIAYLKYYYQPSVFFETENSKLDTNFYEDAEPLLSFNQILNSFSDARMKKFANNLRGVAYYLLGCEFFEEYEGLSKHKPRALKIECSEPLLTKAPQYLLEAQKLGNRDAKAFLSTTMKAAAPNIAPSKILTKF